MKTALALLLSICASASAQAAVNWGISQNGQVYCYPADTSRKVIPGAQPVADSYCFLFIGAEWARNVNGGIGCFPKHSPEIQSPFFNRPISNYYCARTRPHNPALLR